MREKLMALSLVQLREIAKRQGIKKVSALRKAELVEVLVEVSEKNKMEKEKNDAIDQAEENISEVADHKEKIISKVPKAEVAEENADTEKEELSKTEHNKNSKFVVEDGSKKTGFIQGRQKTEKIDNRKGTYRRREDISENQEDRRSKIRKKIVAVGDSRENRDTRENRRESFYNNSINNKKAEEIENLDSGILANGILEVMSEGFGFIRCENYLPGDHDVYVSPSQIRRFNLKTGDIIFGSTRIQSSSEKFAALLYINKVNGFSLSEVERRPNFEDLTPIFPNERIYLETSRDNKSMRIVDLISPIGKGQRGMIVSPPKAGKTTLLKEIAKAITKNNKEIHIIILLIDERPEEVTDIKEYIEGPNVEVIYSTFDELPEHHKRVSEMVLERAKRLVEHGRDVVILLDSITRLARAYNLTVTASGRTLSGGLDPAALHMPKRFFGAARNMREGGSLTILATALVETGSRMDDVVFEEFKGTGNMEVVLDRKLSEKRIFPAIDIMKSGTRRDDLLLRKEEQEAVNKIRRGIGSVHSEDAVERVLDVFKNTKNNFEFIETIKKYRF